MKIVGDGNAAIAQPPLQADGANSSLDPTAGNQQPPNAAMIHNCQPQPSIHRLTHKLIEFKVRISMKIERGSTIINIQHP